MHETAKNEEAALVREALAKLPESYRSVLVLRHYEGLKLREIAEILEIPPGTVNSRMAEALTRLSRNLGPKLSKMQTQTISEPVAPQPQRPSVVTPFVWQFQRLTDLFYQLAPAS